MLRRGSLSMVCLVGGLFWTGMVQAIDASERQALLDFYAATDGPNWDDHEGWGDEPPGTECFWDGVICDEYETHVEGLYLDSMGLKGTLPTDWTGLPYLTELSLPGNLIGGSIPAELAQLSRLRTLNLENNAFTGAIPSELAQLSDLEELNLGYNELEGAIPAELGQLSALTALALSYNGLTGGIPPELGQLGALRRVALDANRLDGTLPPELGQLGQLQTLNVEDNDFSGPLPDTWGGLSNLITLYAAGNRLTGGIPAAWKGMSALRTLDLGDNLLDGPLPDDLDQLTLLRELYLQDNRLSGDFPKVLTRLPSLASLELSGNRLGGPLPTEVGDFAAIQYLRLDGNALSGEIPPSVTNLGTLRSIDLCYNALVASDAAVLTFLDGVATICSYRYPDLDWRHYQTRNPTDLRVDWRSAGSITLAWTPATIPGGVAGGYRVWYGLQPDGPWSQDGGQTSSLEADRLTIDGLTPETTYYFIVRSWSDPHPDNANTLWSYRAPDAGSDLVATTLADGDMDGDGIPDSADADRCLSNPMILLADLIYQGQGNTRLQSTQGIEVQGDGKVEVLDGHQLILETPSFTVTTGTGLQVAQGAELVVRTITPTCN